MPRTKQAKTAYYHVWAMKDGTVVMAIPTRKPSKQRGKHGPPADEDGCHAWSEWHDDAHAWTDWAKAVVRGASVNQINLKKTLRARVECRLDRIEKQLAEIAVLLRQGNRTPG